MCRRDPDTGALAQGPGHRVLDTGAHTVKNSPNHGKHRFGTSAPGCLFAYRFAVAFVIYRRDGLKVLRPIEAGFAPCGGRPCWLQQPSSSVDMAGYDPLSEGSK